MSEYNMSHTGAQLDSAINKVNSGYILPEDDITIKINGTHDVRAFENAVVNVSDSQHFAFGYKTMTANASFEITGLTDQNGDSFTPKGYAFTLLPSVSSAFSGSDSTPSLIACVFDSENKRMTRTRTSNAVHQAFANIGYSSYGVSEGGFKQTASSDEKYNCFGAEYFWIAWG